MGSRSARLGRALLGALLVGVVMAGGAVAATPAPTEPCVAGTVWEDQASGVKYLCVYDELYGGTRWELISSGQRGNRAWTYRSSTDGCIFLTVGLTSIGGLEGGNTFLRSYRWPCATVADRSFQPPGELRVRTVLQRYTTTWATCRDSGYGTNAGSAWTLVAGLRMGKAADCGPGLYRTLGYGQVFQGGAWHGTSLLTPSMWLP
jgi:hypothetical protein